MYTVVQQFKPEGVTQVKDDLGFVVLAGWCRNVALDAADLRIRA